MPRTTLTMAQSRAVGGAIITTVLLTMGVFVYVLVSFHRGNHESYAFIGLMVTLMLTVVGQIAHFWFIFHAAGGRRDYRWHRSMELVPLVTCTLFSVAVGAAWMSTLLQSFSTDLWTAVRAHTTTWERAKLIVLLVMGVVVLALSWALTLFHHGRSKSDVLVTRGEDTSMIPRYRRVTPPPLEES